MNRWVNITQELHSTALVLVNKTIQIVFSNWNKAEDKIWKLDGEKNVALEIKCI